MNKFARQILTNWKEICGSYDHVWVDEKRVKVLAQKFALKDFPAPDWRFQGIFPEDKLAFIAQVLTGDVFNAHFNPLNHPGRKFTVANPVDPAKPFTEAFAMWHRMCKLGQGRVLKASDLVPHVETVKAMVKFWDALPGFEMPSPELKAECGRDWVAGLEKYYQGNPLNLVEEASVWSRKKKRMVLRAFNGGRGLVELLVSKFPIAYGADVQNLDGFVFPFHKRAQLNLLIIHGRALSDQGLIVDDIEDILGIADYDVPNAKRFFGALRYGRDLAKLVANWQEVPKDSVMEIMIRSASLVVDQKFRLQVNRIRQNKGFPKIHVCHDDFWWWMAGKNTGQFSHLTRTSSY